MAPPTGGLVSAERVSAGQRQSIQGPAEHAARWRSEVPLNASAKVAPAPEAHGSQRCFTQSALGVLCLVLPARRLQLDLAAELTAHTPGNTGHRAPSAAERTPSRSRVINYDETIKKPFLGRLWRNVRQATQKRPHPTSILDARRSVPRPPRRSGRLTAIGSRPPHALLRRWSAQARRMLSRPGGPLALDSGLNNVCADTQCEPCLDSTFQYVRRGSSDVGQRSDVEPCRSPACSPSLTCRRQARYKDTLLEVGLRLLLGDTDP